MLSVFTPDVLAPTPLPTAAHYPAVVLCLSGHWGGPEQQTLALTRALYQAGHPVLLAARPDSPLLLEARSQELPSAAVVGGLSGLLPLLRLLRQLQTQVVLTTHAADLGLARLLKLGRPGLRLVHRPGEAPEPTPRLPAWWTARHLPAVDACVVGFPRQARLVQQHSALDPRRLWVVPPVVAPAAEPGGTKTQARHLLDLLAPAQLVGVLARDAAGPAFAIEALYRLREELGVAAELVILGCPETPALPAYWAELRELSGQLRLSHCVHLRPLHNAAHPTLFYRALDVLLLPGSASTTGPHVLGAMAAGCALVSEASADAPDLLEEGVTGLLYAEHHLADCASTLARALQQPETGRTMGRRAAQLVTQRCTLGAQSQQLESVIQYVCRHAVPA